MITKIHTTITKGMDTNLVMVELDIKRGLPAVNVVGLPDKAVQESKERIRSAVVDSGYEFPLGRITINLAPANVVKSGSSYDLPIAVGLLHGTGVIREDISLKHVFVGELSLDGEVKGVTGVLSACLWARDNGVERVYIPKFNQEEGSAVKGVEVVAVANLTELVRHLNGEQEITPLDPKPIAAISVPKGEDRLYKNDFAYIKGQTMAKRALEIAAAGGHNILFIGQPGSGKTLLARSFPTILPTMQEKEVLEVTRIYSGANMLEDGKLISTRPFRAPHHSSSHVALVGGGSQLKPGEISLAHRGVLFLDEFPEFKREVIEVLRQPLEDGFVTISRASGTVVYPSRFYLIAAANPTPSGFEVDDPDALNRPQNISAINRYKAKFSGPILDRIDLQVQVDRPSKGELQSNDLAEKSVDIAARVQSARDIQTRRFSDQDIFTNAEMSLPMIKKYCKLDGDCEKLMDQAIDKFKLSGRSYMRILKLSRTVADLAGRDSISTPDIAESLQYRGRFATK